MLGGVSDVDLPLFGEARSSLWGTLLEPLGVLRWRATEPCAELGRGLNEAIVSPHM